MPKTLIKEAELVPMTAKTRAVSPIFLDEETNTLFAFQKVSGDGGSQDLGQTEIVQRWWKFMADIMKTNPDNSPVTRELEEVFYME